MTTSLPIEAVSPADEAAILALNNEHAAELSWLEPERLSYLLGQAFHTRRVGRLEAFLMAFDQDAAYDSPNYLWFRSRYPRFVYVDRVVVANAARGRGHARRLYTDLFDVAARAVAKIARFLDRGQLDPFERVLRVGIARGVGNPIARADRVGQVAHFGHCRPGAAGS